MKTSDIAAVLWNMVPDVDFRGDGNYSDMYENAFDCQPHNTEVEWLREEFEDMHAFFKRLHECWDQESWRWGGNDEEPDS